MSSLYTQKMVENKNFYPIRWLDAGSLLLAMVLLILLCGRLAATGWVDKLFMIQNILPFACILGVWVGYTRFKFRWMVIIGLIYGGFAVLWLLISIYQPDGTWLYRLDVIIQRFVFSFRQIQADRALSDPILFLWGALSLIWVIAYTGTYFIVRRGRTWMLIVPVLISYLIIDWFDIYYPHRGILILALSLIIIILIARMNLIVQRQGWQDTGSENRLAAERDLIRITILLAIGLGLGISLIPSAGVRYMPKEIVWDDSNSNWSYLRKTFANLFAPLKSDSNFSLTYYSDEFSLGTNANQSPSPAFEVRVDPPPKEDDRFFWRVRTYDTYKLGVWSSSSMPANMVGADDQLPVLAEWKGAEKREFHVKVITNSLKTLYTEREPSGFNLTPVIYIQPEITQFIDIDRVEVDPLIYSGAEYSFKSPILRVDKQELITQKVEDPQEIRKLYLQVPPDLPERVKTLAYSITTKYGSRFEKAKAITDYLRNEMNYQVSMDTVPFGQDPVDYFLFVSKAGFCNYYASAAVMMMRSVGIPARMVVGFAQGELDENEGLYTVRMQDSHAWVEVFFPEYGWIPFEATSSQPQYQLSAGLSRNEIEPTPTPLAIAESQVLSLTPVRTPRIRDPREFEEDFYGRVANYSGQAGMVIPWLLISLGIFIALFIYLFFNTHLSVWITRLMMKGNKSRVKASNWLSGLNFSSNVDQALVLPETALMIGGEPSPGSLTPRERILRWAEYLPEMRPEIVDFADVYENLVFSGNPDHNREVTLQSRLIYKKLLLRMITNRIRFRKITE